MKNLKEGLETEIANVKANTELADKHMDDDTPWNDAELMDTKDIFLKTMEFIRSFDYDSGGEYARKTRFIPPDDLNKVEFLFNWEESKLHEAEDTHVI